MAEDALACFKTLLDCIPVWLIVFEDLASSSVQLQKETLFDRQPVQPRNECQQERLDSGSPRNSRTSDRMEETVRCGSSNGLLRPQLPHLTASDALRLSQRKRKTVSACSDIRSGPLKYRSKAMVIVYYDGNVQKRFENLVRSIGTSRNSLRKGKIGAKVAALARADSTGSNNSHSSQDSVMKIKALNFRTADRRRARGGFETKSEETEAFDKADGLLEKAQDLCERAAHQVLRDGDCSVELKRAKELIVEAQRVGEDELPKLQKRAEQAAERDKTDVVDDETIALSRDIHESDTPSETLISVVPRSSSTGTCSLEVDTEAEESDDGAQKLAINATQLDAHHMRRVRLHAG